MHFINGFLKVAVMDHNNQGLEFQTQNELPYGAGAGGMAPTGIPTYQPSGGSVFTKKAPPAKSKGLAIAVALGKIANDSFSDGIGPQGAGAIDGLGSKSDAADTLATQAKWTFSQSDGNNEMGYNPNGTPRKILRRQKKRSSS